MVRGIVRQEAPPRESVPDKSLLEGHPGWWMTVLVVGCLGVGAILQYDHRQSMNSDGISYLDMASEALRGGVQKLIHPYWSPLYPSLLALWLSVVRPPPELEFPAVQLLNLIVFLAATLCFAGFLRSWLRLLRQALREDRQSFTPRALALLAFALFLWTSTALISIHLVTPDMCVAALIYLTGALCCRLARPPCGPHHWVALGAVLGLGFYAKAAMFPLALALLLILFIWPPSGAARRSGVLLAALVFALVTGPLVWGLSVRQGHPSIGETGKLNYAWYVNDAPRHIGWTGQPPGSGTPTHAPRKLNDDPVVLEFAQPVAGTYPLWYDPAYWHAGLKVSFNLRQQVAALMKNSRNYVRLILRELGSVLTGLFALWLLGRRRRRAPSNSWNPRWTFWWPLSAFALYALVHVETRFYAAFVTVFLLGAYGVVLRRARAKVSGAILAAVGISVLLPVAANALKAAAQGGLELAGRAEPSGQLLVARALRNGGIEPGTPLAVVGDAFRAAYARLARVRIIAQVLNADAFWSQSLEDRGRISAKLRAAGARAIVAKNPPPGLLTPGWREIRVSEQERYGLLLLEGP